MGPIHALVLQLIAKGIVALGISDSTKTGTAKLNDNDVMLYLPNEMNDNGTCLPAYTIDSYWEGLNWI